MSDCSSSSTVKLVMSLCINPACPKPNNPDNHENRFCQSCGSHLELLGRYRVMRLLSDKTEFSKVYEVYEQDTPKILKILKKDFSDDTEAVELFQQEVNVLAQQNYPGISNKDSYFQYQTRNGLVLHCIAMEQIADFNLEEWLKQQHHPISLEAQKIEKVPLLAFFVALLVSFGLLSIFALVKKPSKFVVASDYKQSPQKKGNIDYFSYKKGQDSHGRSAEFNIAVLSVEYKWLLGSNFQIKYNDQTISLNLLNLNLDEVGIQKIMDEPNEIISVGTSCKGDVKIEQRRSLERSEQIQLLAQKLFSRTASVKGYRLLNLGQFLRSDCQGNQDVTAYQRSIIIIGVKQKSAGVILDEALRDRLEKKPFADFRLKDYSLGSVEKFKTIPSNL